MPWFRRPLKSSQVIPPAKRFDQIKESRGVCWSTNPAFSEQGGHGPRVVSVVPKQLPESLVEPFDRALPSAQFQLGTTDLCLQASTKGLKNYVLPRFVIHNSNRWNSLPLGFWHCHLYVRKKWKNTLPVRAPYSHITTSCLPMMKASLNHLKYQCFGNSRVETRQPKPEKIYEEVQKHASINFR